MLAVTNLLIVGLPRSGKTTLIKKILLVDSIGKKAMGFLTEEVREGGQRIGFHLITVPEGRIGLLSQKGLPSSHCVGRYGVDIDVLEEMGCQVILQAMDTENIILVDEIGKMELFSDKFRTALIDALNSPQKVLATIMERPNAFADGIKKRSDVRLLYLTREKFGDVFQEVLNWLDK
ncbi:MAG: AAA family ATPase [Candidatus Aminicenantes bacterium]|nr:MAG: AAA family ATPase [Candidatus Aminicenantes bacterium]